MIEIENEINIQFLKEEMEQISENSNSLEILRKVNEQISEKN